MQKQYDHLRKSFDLSVYFVVGPENIGQKNFKDVVGQAVEGGITFLQIRSKTASARELAECARMAAAEIEKADNQAKIALVIDDRVDIAAALRLEGVKVDGVHLGQSDLEPEFARKILGENAIIGLSARAKDLFDYIKDFKPGIVDYFGAGPLRATSTKPDCGLVDGIIVERTFDDLKKLKTLSPLPVVIGGGVKLKDLPALKATGIDGFFVVSEIASSDNPLEMTKSLASCWHKS